MAGRATNPYFPSWKRNPRQAATLQRLWRFRFPNGTRHSRDRGGSFASAP